MNVVYVTSNEFVPLVCLRIQKMLESENESNLKRIKRETTRIQNAKKQQEDLERQKKLKHLENEEKKKN